MLSKRSINLFCTIIIFITAFQDSKGQNSIKESFDDCSLNVFCVDCGSSKGHYDGDLFAYFSNKFSSTILKGIKGNIFVQVLIDTNGRQCLKSISGQASGKVSKLDLRNLINSMTGWKPAFDNGKPENVSITLQFVFGYESFDVDYVRFNMSSLTNMSSKGQVEIKNRKYAYKNTSEKIKCRVLTTNNSIIPWDMMRAISVDTNNIVWLGSDKGLVKIEEGELSLLNSKTSPFIPWNNEISVQCSDIDIFNNKWISNGYDTYKLNGTNCQHFDSSNSPLTWVRRIYADKYGAVWFVTYNGLIKFDGTVWSIMNTDNSKLPSDKILGVFVDSKKRIWIGTHGGNVMISDSGCLSFQSANCPLKNGFIMKGFEDRKGNIWFSLYDKNDSYNGLACLSLDGNWSIFNTSNSGIPNNYIYDFVIDDHTNTIWMSCADAGITRFDGRHWTIFTPDNSSVPSTYIFNIALDKDGNLWCATFAGLMQIITK